ncbi:uncharacterized protein CLAFUR5_04191 [Fulvia fulva]|uniref:Uncharacterized protein n=1 Tax=Passalora fulva TaxID=5499 RepID=A0A9Q8LFK4_PASFU|nr:uncharacterized protein CLAFUR5_04191 [Fulvia fulva]KAK4627745.1 hypothetical protein CLAFUR0_04213 [Fulvia fulva]UJO16489.1 hypothetical protein CLAFUR5_04191 [Fulvia fulva]
MPTTFFSLPAELRLDIYELAMDKGEDEAKYLGRIWGMPYRNVIPEGVPSLLQVNRQIRTETLPLYFKRYTFSVLLYRWPIRGIEAMEKRAAEEIVGIVASWLDDMGERGRKALRAVEMEFEQDGEANATMVKSMLEKEMENRGLEGVRAGCLKYLWHVYEQDDPIWGWSSLRWLET